MPHASDRIRVACSPEGTGRLRDSASQARLLHSLDWDDIRGVIMMNRTYRRVVGRLRRMGLPPYVLWGTMRWIGWLALGAPAIALANPADLEPSFGTGVKVTTNFPGTIVSSKSIYAIAVQTYGKIVAAGSIFRSFALARYMPDGSLDTSFGSGGKVTTSLGGGVNAAKAVAVQSDGKILAAGSASGAFGLARYNPDGSLDPT